MMGKMDLLQEAGESGKFQSRSQEGKSLAPNSSTKRQVLSFGLIFLTYAERKELLEGCWEKQVQYSWKTINLWISEVFL